MPPIGDTENIQSRKRRRVRIGANTMSMIMDELSTLKRQIASLTATDKASTSRCNPEGREASVSPTVTENNADALSEADVLLAGVPQEILDGKSISGEPSYPRTIIPSPMSQSREKPSCGTHSPLVISIQMCNNTKIYLNFLLFIFI